MIPRGFAFVDLASEEQVDVVIETLNGALVGERDIRVARSKPQSEKRKPRFGPGETKKLYVGNIPFAATNEEIVSLLEPYGEVLDIYIPTHRDTGAGRGFAFVTMKTEVADKVMEELGGMDYEGRRLVINEPLPPGARPPPRTGRKPEYTKIYVGNLSFYTVSDTLVDLFGEFGEVHDCYFPVDRATGSTRGFAFVSMAEENALNAIAELDGCEVDERILRVNIAQSKPRYVEVSDDEDAEEE